MNEQAMNEGTVAFGNTNVKPNTFNKTDFRRFMGVAGVRLRIFLFDPRPVMRKVHSMQKASRRCLSYSGFCPACSSGNKPKDQYGVNVYIYPTDIQGNVCHPSQAAKYAPGIYFWKFNAEKYVQLTTIMGEWGPLDHYDLLVDCTDQQFQKLVITNCRESLCLTNPVFVQHLAAIKEEQSYPSEKVLVKEVDAKTMVTDFQLNPAVLTMGNSPAMIPQNSVPPSAGSVPQAMGPALQASTPLPKTPDPVQQSVKKFWILNPADNKVVEATSDQVTAVVKVSGDQISVMAFDQVGGWKKAIDFGFAVIPVSAQMPSPPQVPASQPAVPTQQVPPVTPPGGDADFDKLFAGLK